MEESMRYIYIDLGCFDGDSIEAFYKFTDLPVSYRKFEIYAFDPNPRFQEKWSKMQADNPNLTFSNKAAYAYDGKIEFTLRPEDAPYGSTVAKEKRDWGQGDVFEVECFDFSTWLKQFDANDYVIVKSDLEGSEYAVFEKVLYDGTDKLIDKLYIEWHNSKMSSDNSEIEDKLLKESSCEILPW